MKKVININFQGQIIAIEETAHEMLKQYIERLALFFAREEGGDEIVNDIECRIAELFGNRLKHGINCITDEDIESIISSIGEPEEFDSEYMAPAESISTDSSTDNKSNRTSTKKNREKKSLYRNSGDQILAGVASGLAHYFEVDPVWIRMIFVLLFGVLFWVYIVLWIVLKPKVLQSNVSKRLYRNPHDRYLGGVCGGFAAYFKIDSWIPRLIFMLPLLLNLIGIFSFFPLNFLLPKLDLLGDLNFSWNFNVGTVLVYAIFWLIIPEAKSVKQKLEMMGEEEYIRSIREKVSDNVGTTRNLKETEKMSLVSDSSERSNVMPSTTERSGCLNALIIMFKIFFFAFVGICALILIGLFVAMLFAGTQLIPLKSLFVDPGFENILLNTALVLVMLVPILSVLIWILRRRMQAKSRPWIGVISMVLWLGGVIMLGVLAARVTNKFTEESSLEKRIELAPITGKKLFVEMQPYHDDYSEFRIGWGPGRTLRELPFTNVDKDSLLIKNIHLQIRNSNDSLFHVRTLGASRSSNLRKAKSDLEQFDYNINQKDSLLYLPEFLAVPIYQGFRNQSITVEILVPAGSTVEVSDMLENYRNNEPPAVVRKRIRKYTSTFMTVEPSISNVGESDDSEGDHKQV